MRKKDDDVRVHVDKHGNVDFKAYRKQLYEMVDKHNAASTSSRSKTPVAMQIQRDGGK